MIICRTPLRISFFGGGTDHPEWFNKNESLVISSTINKYTYIIIREIKRIHDYKFRLRYFKNEEVKSFRNIKHGPYREIIKNLNLQNQPLEVVYTADLPAMSGLGSSSSSTVGMINACTAIKKGIIGKKKLAKDALNIERKILKEKVGCQDQIAAAFGGFNKISFNANDFRVEPFNNLKNIDILNNHCVLYFTGLQRIASSIESRKIIGINQKKNLEKLKIISRITDEALNEFSKKNFSVKKIGSLLHDQWEEKKKLTNGISNYKINKIYDLAKKLGVYGGKLLGAGGGGFFLFICDSKVKKKLKKKLKSQNFVDFKFEFTGSQIIYNGNYSDYNF